MTIRKLVLAAALALPFGTLNALTVDECSGGFAQSDAAATCRGDSSGGGHAQISVVQTSQGPRCRIVAYCRDFQPTSVNGALSTTAVWEYNDVKVPKIATPQLKNCRGDLKFQC